MHKILIADGSPMMHRIMELTFAQESVQVIAASDGDQAMSLLPIARPDVVIADHALPGRTGYEIAAFVKGHADLAHVPVLLLASPFEPLDQERAAAAGVAGEIAKPFDPGQLVARVRNLLVQAPAPAPAPVPAMPAVADATAMRAPALKLVEAPSPPARGALDDYFDRLDAALARLDEQMESAADPSVTATGSATGAASDDGASLPTLDRILADQPPAPRGAVLIDHPLRGVYGLGASESAPAAPPDAAHEDAEVAADPAAGTIAPLPSASDLNALVEALETLQERRAAPAVSLPHAVERTSSGISETRAEALSEVMVDEVTRRVLERLSPGVVDRVVTDVVTRVAERLLREEIARLRRP